MTKIIWRYDEEKYAKHPDIDLEGIYSLSLLELEHWFNVTKIVDGHNKGKWQATVDDGRWIQKIGDPQATRQMARELLENYVQENF